jgi:hypothetical protein
MNPASSAWFGEQISIYGNALVQFSSSSGVQRSGTGSHMNSGFSALGFTCFLRRRIVVTRLIQRVGEQIIWKDLEKRRVGVRSSASRRSLGVVYRKERTSEAEKEFQPRVVRRLGSVRKWEVVCQDWMRVVMGGGNSDPRSIIHDTLRERGGGEKRRAPRAE